MTSLQAISALAATGQLALAIVALLRGGGSPLSAPLALLCLQLFTWNGAGLVADLTGQRGWHLLDVGISPLTTPLALDFVLAFVGQRRRLRWLRVACWAAFGALSATALVAPAFAGSDLWAALHLAGAIPVMGCAVALLEVHRRGALNEEERERTLLLLLGVAIAAVLGTTELWGHFVPGLPALAPLGLLAATTLTTLAALRARLFGRELPIGSVIAALGLAACGIAVSLALFRLLAGNAALLAFGVTTVSFALVVGARQLALETAARRAKVAQLATVGRFSAQLAHDLKNPLAALKGAGQYLREQVARRTDPAEVSEFVQLMLDQVDRLERTLGRYQRLSQVEVARAPLKLNEVVRGVLALEPFAAKGAVEVRAELSEPLPDCSADRDLLATVLENLVRNAFEAAPAAVIVRTAPAPGGLVLTVEDDGEGMDARTRERAFDEFFTTKASGSGLGLPFVRRVAEAHGGSVSLAPRPGRGTIVTLRLPLQ